MAFDLTKRFGTIQGIIADCPTARFEQGGKLYNFHKQEVKSGEVDQATIPPPPPPAPTTAESISRAEQQLKDAKDAVLEKPTPARRKKVSKLEEALNDLLAE